MKRRAGATDEHGAADPYVPERGNPGYTVARYDLELDYTVASNSLRGRALLTVVPTEALDRLTLDLAGLRVTKVTVGGRPARWRHDRAKLHVTPSRSLAADAEVVVDVRYGGRPRPTGSTWGPVGWEELEDGVLVASQPSGACTWFPCNDLARQKAPIRLTVTATAPYEVVASGRLVSRRPRGSGTTWVFEQIEPTAPYLMAFHVGRYEELTLAADPVAVRAMVPGALRRDVERAFARQVEMVEVFVDCFGPYPFEAGYTVVVCPDVLEVPLEAQGQASFGTNHLDGRHERLIAHELAHQWFGNSLTAAAWHDIWLHEGFCCYAEWIWSERSGGKTADEHARSYHQRLARDPHTEVLGDPGPDAMFDDWVYKRGALTLHVLRLTIGDDAFFRLLRRWTAEHRDGVVTTPDFEVLATEVAGRSLQPLFDRWLREVPLPDVAPLP